MDTQNIVREIRAALGWTQQQLADDLGVSVRQVKRYERTGARPQSKAVERNLKALAQRVQINE